MCRVSTELGCQNDGAAVATATSEGRGNDSASCIVIVANPTKTVMLSQTGHTPLADEIVNEEGAVTVVAVPIGTEEHVVGRAVGVVRDGGADCLARCLVDMPDKQAAVLIAVEPLWQRTNYRNSFTTRKNDQL